MPVEQTLKGLMLGLVVLMALAAAVLAHPLIRAARIRHRRSR